MQPLRRPQPAARPDPAPSRLSYKLHRLWLTPLIRSLIRVGIPAFALAFSLGYYLSNPRTTESIVLTFLDLRQQIAEREEFQVRVMVMPGVSDELSQDVQEVVGLDFPVSSFDLDLDQLADRVEELDAVASARVAIRPGGVLEMQIEERTPAVLWQGREALEILDAEGHRVGEVPAGETPPDLPLLVGDGVDAAVPEALALLEAAAALGARLGGLVRIGERRWDLVLREGPRLKLPEANPVGELQRVLAAQGAEDLLDRDIVAVDMRNPRRPVLRLSPEAKSRLLEMRLAAQEQRGADG